MKMQTIRIKLVDKRTQTTGKFVFVKIPVVSNDMLFNLIYMVKDFGCVFLN